MACFGCIDYSVGLGIFPVLFCVVSALTFLTTYMIAVSNNHLYPWLPTISDTGGDKPEANIFSLFLSISSFLCLIVVYIRYRQFHYISDGIRGVTYAARFVCWNRLSFVIGIIASVGAGIVASFQDRGISLLYHGIGALAVFGGGVIYCWIQAYMTYCMIRLALNTRCLYFIRAALSFFATIFLFSFLVTFYYASKDFEKRPDAEKPMTKWNPHDPGFNLHIISSACEWLLATCLFLFFLTFTKEFNKMKVGLRVQRHLSSTSPFMESTASQETLYA